MKRPSWFKWEPTGYWVVQAVSAVAAAVTLSSALFSDETRIHIVIDGVLAGFNGATVFNNWLHRKRDRSVRRMIEIMDDQQKMIVNLHEMKTNEIARMIAEVNGDIVSIQGPDGPITPNPTKH